MKASDLPALPKNSAKLIPQEEIDHINDLYAGMRRQSKQLLKDAMEIGDWFVAARKNLPRDEAWGRWIAKNFPKLGITTVWRFEKLAANREFLVSIMRDNELFSPNEALQMISQQRKLDKKPRVRVIVSDSEVEPIVLLEMKLKNYVIQLWMLRYLQTEIEGMLESMELTAEQVQRVLYYVCKEHHEVEEEVLRTFQPPKLKIVPKNGA